jgi:transcriptional regulator with XRE-family HTH domain
MADKIVRLHTPWKPKTFTSAEAMLEEVRGIIFKDGRTYKVIAEDTGVSGSTIGNIASGKTRWPRHTTLFPLLKAMRIKLTLSQEDEA